MLTTGGPCPPVPVSNRTLNPPVAWPFDARAKAKYPMKRRAVDVSYSLSIGGDQYGGFYLHCPSSLPLAACRDFKWGLPPYHVYRHNKTGLEVYTRRPCAGCAGLQGFNDSGLIRIDGALKCWEWSDIPDAECPFFKPSVVTSDMRRGAEFNHQPLEVCKGQRVEIEIINAHGVEPNEGHPMHLHGHSFEVVRVEKWSGSRWEVLTTNGSQPHDTIHVPWGLKVVIQFDADNAGTWLFHCHNTMHLENGMMTMVVYREAWHPHCRNQPRWTGNRERDHSKPDR